MDLPPTAPVLCSYGDSVGFKCNRFSALISISKISDPVNLKVDIFFSGTTFYQRKIPVETVYSALWIQSRDVDVDYLRLSPNR